MMPSSAPTRCSGLTSTNAGNTGADAAAGTTLQGWWTALQQTLEECAVLFGDSNNDRDICKELALCPLLLFLSPASTSSSGLQCGDSLPHRSCTFAQRVL
jgi:hypothetical protein